MKIDAFKVEEWMNEYEDYAKYNIAETCVDSISMDELFAMTGTDGQSFLSEFMAKRLTYGAIFGAPAFKEGIRSLYKTLEDGDIVTTHGAAGANHLALYSLVEPGDKVVSVLPTYQQLYSIPASYGADVRLLPLKKEDDYAIDLSLLRSLVKGGAKVICINNPNNPTGALMEKAVLMEIVEIARSAGAYILCDEVYRHLNQQDGYTESIADLYEKGISVSSMSKVFSLAGIRLGWIASKNAGFIKDCLSHRDYSMISCGMLDEALAALALKNKDALLARNRGIVRNNLAILDGWIKENPGFSYVKPKAGTTALVYYPADMPSREYCLGLFNATGAFVTPGDCFEQEGCFRIGYASDEASLRGGLAAIAEYTKGL